MSDSLYLNNGQIFTVAEINNEYSCYGYSQYTTAIGLAYESDPATWINGMSYITDDLIANSDQDITMLLLLQSLNSRGLKSYHADLINNYLLLCGQFIWGDIYNGGLYVYKQSQSTYGFILFSGYGEDVNDSDYDIFYYCIHTQAVTSEQMYFTILKYDTSGNYRFFYGGDVFENGTSVTYSVEGEPQHLNPVDQGQVTNVYYVPVPNSATPLVSTLSNNNQFIVNPIGGNPNYMSSQHAWLLHSDDIEGFENTDFINYDPNTFDKVGWTENSAYIQDGSWWGGDGNKAGGDPMSGGGSNQTGGGGGNPSEYSEPCGLPSDTQYSVNALTSGFFNIFHCTGSEMTSFNQWLWQSFTEGWWDNLKKILQDPLSFVIGAGMIRHTPTVNATKEITFNGIGTEVFASPVSEQITELDCGELSIDEQWKTSLDYAGYSDTKIFLPYIGIYSLDQNEVMDSVLHIYYKIDNLTGACIALLNIDKKRGSDQLNSALYKFTGNCMYQLPVNSKDYQNAINAGINIATSVVGASSGSGSVAGALGSVASNVMNLKPSVFRSGNLATNYGYMDSLKPYLIFERPEIATPDKFGSFRGYPSASMVKIKACKGFFCVRNTDTMKLKNMHATDDEKRMIMELLRNGVYFQEQEDKNE